MYTGLRRCIPVSFASVFQDARYTRYSKMQDTHVRTTLRFIARFSPNVGYIAIPDKSKSKKTKSRRKNTVFLCVMCDGKRNLRCIVRCKISASHGHFRRNQLIESVSSRSDSDVSARENNSKIEFAPRKILKDLE